ncbi:MAG: hypothetical protein ACFFEE_11655 [Candidatus Thorarchaeota archaeon]
MNITDLMDFFKLTELVIDRFNKEEPDPDDFTSFASKIVILDSEGTKIFEGLGREVAGEEPSEEEQAAFEDLFESEITYYDITLGTNKGDVEYKPPETKMVLMMHYFFENKNHYFREQHRDVFVRAHWQRTLAAAGLELSEPKLIFSGFITDGETFFYEGRTALTSNALLSDRFPGEDRRIDGTANQHVIGEKDTIGTRRYIIGPDNLELHLSCFPFPLITDILSPSEKTYKSYSGGTLQFDIEFKLRVSNTEDIPKLQRLISKKHLHKQAIEVKMLEELPIYIAIHKEKKESEDGFIRRRDEILAFLRNSTTDSPLDINWKIARITAEDEITMMLYEWKNRFRRLGS